MSKDHWQTYRNRLNKNGLNQKDRIIANTQRTIIDQFSNSPSYYEVTVNGISQDVQIIEDSASRKDSEKKRIICKPNDDLNIGDAIVWDSNDWLCTDIDDVQIYIRGIIERCNNNLIYLDSDGEIITVPCVITNKILMNQKENDYYILPDNKIMVMVADNDDSKEITVDSRFLLGSNAFKVESIDNITKPGIITLKMHFDSITQNDNKDLGIANYYSNLQTYTIKILNGDEVDITLGESLQLVLECTENDVVVIDPYVEYSLSTGSTGYISVDASGVISADALGSGSVIAYYKDVTDYIDIDVVAGVVENYIYDIVGSIQPENEIKYNQTKTYTAYKYYNTGTEVTGSFEFTVTLGTGASSSNYLLTTSTDDSVTLKCLQYPYTISLVAVDQDDITQSVTQVISLKGLI